MEFSEKKLLPMRLYGVKHFRLNQRYFGYEFEVEFFENKFMSKVEIEKVLEKIMEQD